MALIKCPECKREISDKAKICVGCGFPIDEYIKRMEEDRKAEERLNSDIKKCADCGSSDIDSEGYCNECGMKMKSDTFEDRNSKLVKDDSEQQKEPTAPYTICPQCGLYNEMGVFECVKCGHKYTTDEYNVLQPAGFQGIYKVNQYGKLQEVFCPRCGSEDCSHYHEQKFMPGKTKTRYTMNLNPFRPFTLVNKKERTVRQDRIVTEHKFVCNKCGKIFQ